MFGLSNVAKILSIPGTKTSHVPRRNDAEILYLELCHSGNRKSLIDEVRDILN
jgi:hypothetical protein